VKAISQTSDSAPFRLAYWLVAAVAVPVVLLVLIEMPGTLAWLVASAAVSPATAAPPRALNASGTGVPDASQVFSGREIPLEEPTPTF
jgi:hypothetical protein